MLYKRWKICFLHFLVIAVWKYMQFCFAEPDPGSVFRLYGSIFDPATHPLNTDPIRIQAPKPDPQPWYQCPDLHWGKLLPYFLLWHNNEILSQIIIFLNGLLMTNFARLQVYISHTPVRYLVPFRILFGTCTLLQKKSRPTILSPFLPVMFKLSELILIVSSYGSSSRCESLFICGGSLKILKGQLTLLSRTIPFHLGNDNKNHCWWSVTFWCGSGSVT